MHTEWLGIVTDVADAGRSKMDVHIPRDFHCTTSGAVRARTEAIRRADKWTKAFSIIIIIRQPLVQRYLHAGGLLCFTRTSYASQSSHRRVCRSESPSPNAKKGRANSLKALRMSPSSGGGEGDNPSRLNASLTFMAVVVGRWGLGLPASPITSNTSLAALGPGRPVPCG